MSTPHSTGQRGPADEPHDQNSNNPSQESQIPVQILQQADAAAASAASAETSTKHEYEHSNEIERPIEDVPPPPYSAQQYGEVDFSQHGFDTGARVAKDGRVDIKISSNNLRFSSILRRQIDVNRGAPSPEPEIPDGLGYISGLPPPPMNIVIQIVGSRGDVQPFIALGLVLKNKFNHRVRVATHPVFKDFVNENGLEFFSIGGDPAELMAFMVKNPGLMPGIEALRSGDIGKRRKGVYEMLNGCWRSCIEPGDGTGPAASDAMLEGHTPDAGLSLGDPNAKPFIADAIIANPPSFAHIHAAEKLGVPLHLMFTMPWSPTQAFPHPLANIVSSNADPGLTNFMSYILVDLLTWQGLGDVINRFREKTLRLEPLSVIWAPGNLQRLRIPWTYCWSPALIPKPDDWSNHIDLSGFYFLNLATNYTPAPDLAEFLEAGPPPVYIGFGSIVVENPNDMTRLIFDAVKKTGQRALVSKGWGGFSGDEIGVPEGVFMLGNVPHDWLFKKVSCVVHHGGAGTTAAGITAGRPTVIVPFFGDQQFWGQMCQRAGAGPDPIPQKELTADKLAEAINFALKPEVLDRAAEMSNKIKQETGSETGADSFHRHLSVTSLRCSICPGRVAAWQYKRTDIRLSALAATVLANQGLVDFSDLRLFRGREYAVETGPPEPISGGAAALMGTIGSVTAGIADYPTEILRSFKKGSTKNQANENEPTGSSATASTAATRDSSSSRSNKSNTELSESTFSTDQPSTAPTEPNNRTAASASDARSPKIMIEEPESIDSRDVGQAPGSPASNQGSRSLNSYLSQSSSRSQSRSSTPKGHERRRSVDRAQQITMDSLIGSAKATGNIVAAGMKSPVDFTLSLAQGFHNAPKLYGDKTVRRTEKVTDFQSGLKVAGKEFGYGFYDGITGLVTQPLQGAREEGFAGFSKGLLRGSFGLILKPGAAIWGLPGYTMKGVYQEITKNFGKTTTNYIIAARTAQGYEEWKASSEGERERIVTTWKGQLSLGISGTKKSKQPKPSTVRQGDSKFYDKQGRLLSGFRATRNLTYDERKELARLKQQEKEAGKQSSSQSLSPETTPNPSAPTQIPAADEDEFEQAIRAAVRQTSNNNPEEDARIERALRASVRELQKSRGAISNKDANENDEDDAYSRAVAASIAEYQRQSSSRDGQESGTVSVTLHNEHDDAELQQAITRSLEETRVTQNQARSRGGHHSDNDTEDDEGYQRAIKESSELHGVGITNMGQGDSATKPGLQAGTSNSRHAPALPARSNNAQDSEDEELKRVLEASELEARQRETDQHKQQTEEDIVLEYVKKQSLQEEEYRRQKQQQ